jgi:citrate lyase subunit beta/citryl-CoA lyase
MSALAERLKERPPRTLLFVPAPRAPEWLPKAIASGADGVIVDLEDATAPGEKDRAREIVRGLGIAPREHPAIVVRVNSDPDVCEPDCAAAVASGADGIILPKVEGPFAIRRAAWFLSQTEQGRELAIMPMIETARSVLVALELAEADMRVAGLCFGGGDRAAQVGWTRTREGDELAQARSQVVLAAGARGLGSVDTPWLDIADVAGAAAEARHVARLGFTGKFVIHPSHVGPINAAFTPSADEVEHARGLLAAFDAAVAAGSGIATYKGHMIDKPDALQARRVLARASLGSTP